MNVVSGRRKRRGASVVLAVNGSHAKCWVLPGRTPRRTDTDTDTETEAETETETERENP